MADQVLTFFGWSRERMAALATGVRDGRALVTTQVTLAGTDAAGAPTTTHTGTVQFLLAGPADVVRLQAGAVTGRYPTPGTTDHETDRCPHVEFADVALPWRYTPAPRPAAGTGDQHPWLVLVVGVEGVEVTLADVDATSPQQATLTPAVQLLHPLGTAGSAHRWAHVQQDAAGRRVARILSGRPLSKATEYLAVLVPAFDAAGAPRWNGSAPVTVPVHDSWRFRTADTPGSFEDLAGRLHPGAADPATGRAPLDYPRLPAAPDLSVRGALAPLGAGDAALPAEVRDDLDALRTPARDERGRPIVGLPRYGEAWRTGAAEQTTWGATLNTDPRDRGVAGLGLELGVRLQEELAAEAAEHLGALAEARQRIRDLTMGLSAAAGLWGRRTPQDPLERLWLLGPALRRVVTPDGAVADLATAPDRPLPPGLFSTAARRILRPGPARTALGATGRAAPGDVLAAANTCPAPPRPRADGVPLDGLGIDPKELEDLRRRAVETGEVDTSELLGAAKELADRADPDLAALARAVVTRLRRAVDSGAPAPWAQALALLVAAASVAGAGDPKAAVKALAAELNQFVKDFPAGAGERDLVDLLTGLEEPRPVEPPCRPVDLDALATAVSAAFDPTREDAAARVRVLGGISGLDPAQPLAPPEVCVGLDRPVWDDVRAAFEEWLLPGVGALPQDSIIAVETNPRFVDSLLVGLNTQLLAELRWRNLPVATGCTPLREFWARRDRTTGAPVPDVVGITNWADPSDVGAAQHRPPGASGRDLVIVVRGQLFLRYPTTVLYLVTAEHAGLPDFGTDPDPAAPHVFPGFQGRIGTDVTFFGFPGVDPDTLARQWLVLEEPPRGYRFANDASVAPAPQTWARASFARPVRVLIRGDRLDPEG